MRRREVLAALAMAPCLAQAQPGYPDRPVKVIIPFPPGGPSDVQGRLVCLKLQERLGQPFVVENRSGASGNISTRAAATAPADGYTLLVMTPAQVINVFLSANAGYDLARDFAPISLLSVAPAVLLAHPSLQARNYNELVARLRERTTPIAFGSAGAGLSTHLMMEMVRKRAGLEMLHVPYRGSAPALQALAAGEVMLLMDSMVSGMALARAGHAVPLAVTSAGRSQVAPDVPTLAESGLPGFDAVTWYGLMAPRATPAPVLQRLAQETAAVLQDADTAQRLRGMGSEPARSDPESFGRFLQQEAAQWAELARASGARIE